MICLAVLCELSRAATWNSPSASHADVSATIANVAVLDGDTVNVPAGTASWTTNIHITKGIKLIGAGTNNTIILDDIPFFATESPQTEVALIYWSTVTNTLPRLSGFTFRHGSARTQSHLNGVIQLFGDCATFRMDNIWLDNIRNRDVYVGGAVFGVADNIKINKAVDRQPFFFQQGTIGGGTNGDGSWETDPSVGGPLNFYVEDFDYYKTLTTYGFCDGWNGGRCVIRFGTIRNSRLGNHGTESGQRLRSHRWMEIYNNTIQLDGGFPTEDHAIDYRGGGGVVVSNVITGSYNSSIKLNNYRSQSEFPPWGVSDGTTLWDGNTTLGAPFDFGTATGGSGSPTDTPDFLEDSTKSWTVNEWVGYTLRKTYTNTATSGGVRTLTVSGASWPVNQWAGFMIRKDADSSVGRVSSNTSDTLTMATDYYAITFAGGGAFNLYRAREISSNTSTSITVMSALSVSDNLGFSAGETYDIRKVNYAMDCTGRGKSQPIVGSPPNNQNIGQTTAETFYQWANLKNGVAATIANQYREIVEGRDYSNNVASPTWTAYPYPHPLREQAGVVTSGGPPRKKPKRPR